MQNNTGEALAAFDRALTITPDYVPALRGKVQLLYRMHDKRAVPALHNLIKLDPKDKVAHEMLATLQARSGNCTSAIGHFESSAETVVGHASSLELYGYCLQQTKQTEKAVGAFQRLVALVPDQAYAKYDLAVVLVDTKQYAAALKTLEPLLGPGQSDPDILSLAAEAYEATGDTPNAVSRLRQAIVLNPKNAAYYTAFALLCFDHESYNVGVDVLTLGLQQIADSPSLYVSRGLLYAQLAQYQKAEDDFKAAESIDSKQNLSSYAMDLADVEKDRPDLALAKVRAQLRAHPNSAQHHYLLAKLLEKESSERDGSSSKEAIAAALTAVKLRPGFTEARDLLASLYLNAQQYQLAKEECELALKDDPLDQAAIYHLIVALRHSSSTADREQVGKLVKRLAEAQLVGRERDLNRKRFKLVEEAQSQP
jgi:tetratricopeptide (TPR) repeat protein